LIEFWVVSSKLVGATAERRHEHGVHGQSILVYGKEENPGQAEFCGCEFVTFTVQRNTPSLKVVYFGNPKSDWVSPGYSAILGYIIFL
jgi:hypothetical protein